MANFNPENFDNTLNPYTLSEEKQREVIETVDDERLSNPLGDYFQLELKDKTIDIPKLEYVSKKTKDDKITRLPVAEYIRKQLEEEEK